MASAGHWMKWTAVGICAVALALTCLNYFTPTTASPEWIYTLEWLNLLLLPPIALGCFIIVFSLLAKNGRSHLSLALCCLTGCAFLTIPFLAPNYQLLSWHWQYALSACWGIGFLLAGIGLIALSTHLTSFGMWTLCLLGSLLLGLATAEFALLCSSQRLDGITNLSAASKYALQEQGQAEYLSWTPGVCSPTPGPSGKSLPAFARFSVFDRDLYDVKYNFNDKGWRRLPIASPNAPNDLVLFGCSFTFGIGLEDEETWAWQLATLLGPQWKLNNYAAGSYGANQMLCMLERHLIEPPSGVHRYALFLGIKGHLQRNTFFPNTPHYELDKNHIPVQTGSGQYQWIYKLPELLNGSQLARDISLKINNIIMAHPGNEQDLYIAMIQKAAEILSGDYKTQLIVLLWPDLDDLQTPIEKLGIRVILARALLKSWDETTDPGAHYKIDPIYEGHPNKRAATELANGLAQYFKHLTNAAMPANK